MALPEGWREVTLGDVVAPISDRETPDPATEIPFIGMEHVEGQSGRVLAYGDASDIKSASPLVEPGDILYGRLRPYLNKVAIAPEKAYTSGEFIVFRGNDEVDGRWLKWRFTARDFVDYAISLNAGDRPRVKWPQMRPFRLQLPPLDEQHRIVELLEEHLCRIDAAEHGLAQSDRSTAALIRSALAQGLRGELVEDDLGEGTAEDVLGSRPDFEATDGDRVWAVPEGWLWARLGDAFEVHVGATPPRGDAGAWAGDLPWVSSGEVTFSRISQTREHITREAAGNPSRRIHPPGTVMLAMIGEGKTRGQAAILDIEAAHNQNCASIRVSETKVLPEYVYGYMEERYLETRRAGSGGQQQALNKAAIQRFPIPIPPLATQRRIVEAWDGIRSAAARLDDEVARASLRSLSLRRALLAAAFSGRLTGASTDGEAA
ncbi:MAG: restriction endonuclease subunit S [Actinomycetota bacterium]|nr:restriction endonuclease subunit S [Actinomycetota bacterium]